MSSLVYGTNTELLGTYSEMWEFNNTFIVRTRRTLNHEKLLIDITELHHHVTPNPIYATKLARNAARRFSATSMDFGLLATLHSSRKVSDGSGMLHTVNVTRQTYVFDAAK